MWKVVRKLATIAVGVLLAGVTAAAHGEDCSLTGPLSEIYVPMVHSSCGDDCFTHVLATEEDLTVAIDLVCPAGTTPVELTGSSELVADLVVLDDDFVEEPTATVSTASLEEICRQRLGAQWAEDEYHEIEGPDLSTVVTFAASCTPAGQERAATCTRELTVVCEDHCMPAQYWELVKGQRQSQIQPGDPGPPYCLCSWSGEVRLGLADGEALFGLSAIYHLPRFRSLQLDLGTRDGSDSGVSRVDLIDLSYSFYLRPTQQFNPRLFFGAGWAFVDESAQGPPSRLDDGATFHLGLGFKWSFLNRRTYLSFDARARWLDGDPGSGFELEATGGLGLKFGCCGERIRGPRGSDKRL